MSGCTENKALESSETTADITTSATISHTEEITTTTTDTEETTVSKTAAAETTVSETTASDTTTTFSGKVVSETTSQAMTAETSDDNSASTDELEPPPEIDKDMFTLY
ncbi:MAG: hypothetical protein IK093_08450, partial [Ruminiclostridium sp.]|nr:hypothetical protein [Ruminiclostridium sp.]